jgi:hypothetical protein
VSDRIYIAVYLFVLALAGLFPVDAISQRMQPLLDRLPPYVKNIPKDHFLGISTPMPSLAEARFSAINDAKRQILKAMGSNYLHAYVDHSSGDVVSGKIKRTVDDVLINNSRGYLLQIEDNIVNGQWLRDESGNYICFILIRCSGKLMHDMKRLSRGALVTGRVIEFDANQVVLDLTESNGVCVTFLKATVSITHLHNWAKTVTLFIWRVEEETEVAYEISIHPLSVCAQKKQITINLGEQVGPQPLFSSLSSSTLKAALYGFDEVGRPVIIQMKSN